MNGAESTLQDARSGERLRASQIRENDCPIWNRAVLEHIGL